MSQRWREHPGREDRQAGEPWATAPWLLPAPWGQTEPPGLNRCPEPPQSTWSRHCRCHHRAWFPAAPPVLPMPLQLPRRLFLARSAVASSPSPTWRVPGPRGGLPDIMSQSEATSDTLSQFLVSGNAPQRGQGSGLRLSSPPYPATRLLAPRWPPAADGTVPCAHQPHHRCVQRWLHRT